MGQAPVPSHRLQPISNLRSVSTLRSISNLRPAPSPISIHGWVERCLRACRDGAFVTRSVRVGVGRIYAIGEGEGQGIHARVRWRGVEICFETIKLDIVEARIRSTNERSKAVARKSGFKNIGQIKKGKWGMGESRSGDRDCRDGGLGFEEGRMGEVQVVRAKSKIDR